MGRPFSEQELLAHLKSVLWDVKISPEEALAILRSERDEVRGFTRTNLFTKLVNGYNWHTVRRIIPEKYLKEALSDQVISALFPRSLREKYRNARQLL